MGLCAVVGLFVIMNFIIHESPEYLLHKKKYIKLKIVLDTIAYSQNMSSELDWYLMISNYDGFIEEEKIREKMKLVSRDKPLLTVSEEEEYANLVFVDPSILFSEEAETSPNRKNKSKSKSKYKFYRVDQRKSYIEGGKLNQANASETPFASTIEKTSFPFEVRRRTQEPMKSEFFDIKGREHREHDHHESADIEKGIEYHQGVSATEEYNSEKTTESGSDTGLSHFHYINNSFNKEDSLLNPRFPNIFDLFKGRKKKHLLYILVLCWLTLGIGFYSPSYSLANFADFKDKTINKGLKIYGLQSLARCFAALLLLLFKPRHCLIIVFPVIGLCSLFAFFLKAHSAIYELYTLMIQLGFSIIFSANYVYASESLPYEFRVSVVSILEIFMYLGAEVSSLLFHLEIW
eukprot:CAMPEP_0170519242 /NCGR_PEP_ID=MMETSP0209-20121228/4734_1 /TAXON_ID=665100 ORGANISM="Litonotus pictus, Strain P1" /NCGR_SAMPLE_ID=MMETSP0209 /ASSEMBLY_ACC=CAM_ASM_000301 /LENGTH=404 /DNA_ID=CAMNT_0010805083 /DNA_START=736 /DNA_END=1947 /DNA_ORIENTATION=-